MIFTSFDPDSNFPHFPISIDLCVLKRRDWRERKLTTCDGIALLSKICAFAQ